MKTRLLVVLHGVAALLAPAATAQVIPTQPGKFKMKPFGETGASASIGSTTKQPQTTVRQVTYIALSPTRQWRSSDGKSLLGKLIAFEETVVTTTTAQSAGAATQAAQNAPAPPPPALPAAPTVVRDGKVRLLVESKTYEVPLERLVEDDRLFVEAMQIAMKSKAAKK